MDETKEYQTSSSKEDPPTEFSGKQFGQNEIHIKGHTFNLKPQEKSPFDHYDQNVEAFKRSFSQQSGFVSETWTKNFFLSGRIAKVEKEFVQAEVLIYGEDDKKVYQLRRFPRMLFSHIAPLEEGAYVKIKIGQKPGATKTEIINGKGLGIEKEFEEEDFWKDLENIEMDEPPKKNE